MMTSPQGGKRVWNVITTEKYSFFSLKDNLLPFFFKAWTGGGPVDALKVQSSNSSRKVSRVQVCLLTEGPTSVNVFFHHHATLQIKKHLSRPGALVFT